MADMYGSHFEYGGVSSKTHGMIIANVETTRFTQVAGTIAGVTIFNKSGKRNYLIDDDYSGSPLSFEVDITTDDNSTLDKASRRTIEKWLFNRHNYRKLYLEKEKHLKPSYAYILNHLFLSMKFLFSFLLKFLVISFFLFYIFLS